MLIIWFRRLAVVSRTALSNVIRIRTVMHFNTFLKRTCLITARFGLLIMAISQEMVQRVKFAMSNEGLTACSPSAQQDTRLRLTASVNYAPSNKP